MRPRLSHIALFSAAIVLSGGAYFDAFAHKGATGIVKDRMHVMKGMADNLKLLTKMLDGDIPYDRSKAEAAAASIEEHGGKAMTKMFPKGSLKKPTEAIPKIWENWDDFEASAMRMQAYAGALKHSLSLPVNAVQPAAAAGDMTVAGAEGTAWPAAVSLQDQPPKVVLDYMVKACKSCHEGYRIKKKDG